MTLVRLVATDLDHTLLRSDRSVSDRTVAALDSVRAAGVLVVPATARNVRGVHAVNGRTGFAGWAVCGNGASGVHLGSGEVLFSLEAAPESLTRVITTVLARVPGTCFATVRDCGARFLAEDNYAALASAVDHSRDPASMERTDVAGLVSAPAGKLVFRHPTVRAAALFDEVAEQVRALDDVEITLSGAPFVEVMAAGVSKAAGLARLCSRLGIGAHEVLALGDGVNDVDMLRWAGRGVAVANADPAALAAADEVTAYANDDGVAQVLEQLSDQLSNNVPAPRRSS
ncbi:HAD family hydrolase [Corynebacterium sp. USCH3]|uniref:HAD family hydrolase n=1 Tax=Corynebacterium sp. USCH3 TaxID=3024840 RepID=UPI0030A2492E